MYTLVHLWGLGVTPPVEKFRKIITVTVTVMEYLWENFDQQIKYLRKVRYKLKIE